MFAVSTKCLFGHESTKTAYLEVEVAQYCQYDFLMTFKKVTNKLGADYGGCLTELPNYGLLPLIFQLKIMSLIAVSDDITGWELRNSDL